ncbi:hypothetical protein PHYBLDRAFT_73885 [Phycomyces blakesleeanus NRRL 1555(-)]|uniref:Uncharacterized protein n=1 Tax=Phycomyces blakesleeanus (strain ATCC 8743b / DSM 1359 / FGSC 10004 / NBRC 33097 / NRRL 1555) TaxID=763407 RepID=A0A163DS74_PHYB8|nr:hypothetical protein PHYBLDRAFT_73885 [Phycomyces blakesleeanus NRRL 1555(-)]OAD73110.1 hypothetical protein PHYBLDRAFT_73885 [Phycomyces blakesleeanus NRRL 1555(-)]|eukprot:XP_018291150.1 hypothetical protein PHYBLDRAFT_73885 [Phycomyces blakesleeanus NRRL 1555(-)]
MKKPLTSLSVDFTPPYEEMFLPPNLLTLTMPATSLWHMPVASTWGNRTTTHLSPNCTNSRTNSRTNSSTVVPSPWTWMRFKVAIITTNLAPLRNVIWLLAISAAKLVTSRGTANNISETSEPEINKDVSEQYTNVTNEEPETMSEENCDPCLTADQHFLEDLHAAVDTDLPLYAAILDGQQILVLIDSGASANYVSLQISHLATHILDIPGRSVETAGGHSIKIHWKATLNLSLNGYTDTINAFVFPTKFDLILGCTWLQMAKPVPDWHVDSWSLHCDEQEFILRPHGPHPTKPHRNYLISAKQIEKLSRREEAKCFFKRIRGRFPRRFTWITAKP